MTLKNPAFTLPTLALVLASWGWLPTATRAIEPAGEGIVTYAMSYQGMGPMSSMLPKEQRIYFKDGKLRIESGEMNATVIDREAGTVTSFFDFGATGYAFRYPVGEDGEVADDYELEPSGETREIAGVRAERIDVVDPTDPNNRVSVWVTGELGIAFSPFEGLEGLALDYVQIMGEGESHAVATAIERGPVEPELFSVPTDYELILLESGEEIMKKLQELQGGNVSFEEMN